MNYKIFIIIISILFLASCEHNRINKDIIKEKTINNNVLSQNDIKKKIIKKKNIILGISLIKKDFLTFEQNLILLYSCYTSN